ncbi:phosphatidylcholine/phosphatidylserine synthase [Mangrovibacterium marinum]|uniref:CDP-diacylglycerol--serine O-phosphatidyltransferase n=1 Tax=Mangrovibacterium marinum TaxID=1639118 RepID=A0A2T5C5W4_9BACT|nr:CDP-alcohol phosphatidyltransferase family protein [Mangrovibacterium marinum]PTN10310.1 CDP-diacylglycerol--serine O-phosphatidyltransferase [Mangrovibacterium marinum]
MKTVRNFFFWVPNFITSLNLVAGSVAVFLGVQGYLGWAAICIALASVFDFMDGMAARLLHSYSEIGKQMDSLADLVSFGLAPAAMLTAMLQLAMFGEVRPLLNIEASWLQWVFLFSALLVPVAGAFRLAKFNLDTRQTESFLGLPIPANALFYASLAVVVDWGSNAALDQVILNRFNLLTAIAIISALMISEIPMFSLKFKNLKWKGNEIRLLFLLLCVALFVSLNVYGLPLIIISYITISLVQKVVA